MVRCCRLAIGACVRGALAGTSRRTLARLTAATALALATGSQPSPVRADDLERAIALADEGRYDEARQVISPLLELRPDHIRARLLWGILQVHEGRLEEAARLFKDLSDTYPERSEPYNNLAAVYVAQGRLDDAHTALLAAVARQPALPIAHENLADLYDRLAHRSDLRARALAEEAQAPAGSDPPPQSESAEERAGPDGQVLAVPAEPTEPRDVAGAGTGSDGQSLAVRAEAAPEIGIVATGTTNVCAVAAGFEVPESASIAEDWLTELGAEARVRQERSEVVRDHRVYLPPLPSRTEANRKVEEIRARGIEDIAVIRHGDLANGVSLGVYRSPDNMRRRVAALEGIGLPVEYETTLETAASYAVEARLRVLPAFLRADWSARFPDHPLQVADCSWSK